MGDRHGGPRVSTGRDKGIESGALGSPATARSAQVRSDWILVYSVGMTLRSPRSSRLSSAAAG